MPRPPAECGTFPGYNAHKRRGEQPCQPCREAMRTYHRLYAAGRWANLAPDEHGTPTAYSSYGCRCPRCKKAGAERSRAQQLRDRAQPMADDDPRHGTLRGYNALGCRCDACRAASAAHLRRLHPVPDPFPHATLSGFGYGCRCDPCRRAKSEHSRSIWQRKRDTT